ncbi:MAG: LD-carboxypeptidase [Vicinamibacterales bacterium]|nr:LD-carboxypeptidase [Vicinamibacterales bacterium]
MRKPRVLSPGDRVALVALASPFDRDRFDAGVREIETLGLCPVVTDGLFARRGYVAGEAQARAAALNAAWADRSIAAVMAARGGYGSAQILPFLDRALFRGLSKAFIGHSDLTALLSYLTCHCDTTCFHGPMVLNLGDGEARYDRASFTRSLMAVEPVGELVPDGLCVVTAGLATGPLLGGTLTQLTASLGTPFAFAPPAGFVLLLDEIGERPYRVDRMLTQLAASGLLSRASGIVCGEFPECDEPHGGPTARDVVADFFETFTGPVVFGFPTGHTRGPALTVPLGVGVTLEAGRRSRLVFTESAVI